jgi:hypothetical protein
LKVALTSDKAVFTAGVCLLGVVAILLRLFLIFLYQFI